MNKTATIFTFSFDRKADKELFDRYSEISLLLGSESSGDLLPTDFEKGKQYRVTIEEVAQTKEEHT